jgi:phosphonatase-like hydrolase
MRQTKTASPMASIDLVIFDMAGTTVEDGGQVPAAFAAALAEQGVTLTPAEMNAVRGASKRQAVLELTPPGLDRAERAAATYDAFKRHLARSFIGTARAIPGAIETFAWLRQRGIKIALNTGFDRDITDLLLTALGWNGQVVDAVVCGDDVPQGRPAPYLIFRCLERTSVTSSHRVAALGDTVLDLQAGHNAGVAWNIGVLSGAHSREQLQAEPHTHLIASVADLPTVFTAG